ncbi:MAG TPA: 2Fe-2S iron-sulfur cluster-binding protein [Blastocatellia bacterium]|nr:2Fe-2S iron-sulfur cluster-binding protein [Blastocatellia bacterium]
MPKLTVNGQEIDVPPGTTIIQAAAQAGINIPHYCYHEDLPIDGNCRMCLVEVEKMPKLTPACATVVGDGMVVNTTNERVKEAVRGVLEFLLINHPVDCPVCDQAGECRLQDYYMIYGLHTNEIPLDMKVRKHKVVDLGPMVVLDSERCVLCSRCIRFFDTVTGTGEMQFFGRGDHVEIGTFENKPLDNPYSGNVVDVCPVGALTSRDFRFKCRVWFLHSTDSVCGGCSTGCTVRIDHRDGSIFRVLARRNIEVNKSWLCDEGRLSFHQLAAGDRQTRPMLKGRDGMQAPAGWQEAILAVDAGLKRVRDKQGAGALLGFASPSATNEALFLFKQYMAGKLGASQFEFRLDSEDKKAVEKEDAVLRYLDKHPNSVGAMNLGFGASGLGSIDGAIRAAREGRIKAAVIIYLRPLVQRPGDAEKEAKLGELLTALEYSVLLAAHKADWQSHANAVLPVAPWSEEEGTYTNYQGRIQAAKQAIGSEGDILPIWQVMAMLLEAAGERAVWMGPPDVFEAMTGAVALYEGISYASTKLPGIVPSAVAPPGGD